MRDCLGKFLCVLLLVVLYEMVMSVAAHGQPLPPETGWSWQSALVWQVPVPVETVTLAIATPFTIQASPDLQNWYDTAIPAQIVFTVSNAAPQRFYRAVRKQTFYYTFTPENLVDIREARTVYLGQVSTNYDGVKLLAWKTDGAPALQIFSADPLFTVTLPLDVPLLSFYPSSPLNDGNMTRFYQLNF